VGLATGSITLEIYTLILTIAILTMTLTPFISGQTARLYSLKKRWFKHEPLEAVNIPWAGLRGHALIAGGGRVGRQVSEVLSRLGLSQVVVELDHRRVEAFKEAGTPVVYGDASHEIVLDAASVVTARLLIVTTPDMLVSRAVVDRARVRNPGIGIVARTSDEGFLKSFREMGVSDVVLPEFEAALAMTRQVLLHLEIPTPEIQRQTENLRGEMIEPHLGPSGVHMSLAQLKAAEQHFDLQWFGLDEGCPLIGISIKDSGIGGATGALVVGVIRGSELKVNPGAGFVLAAGDQVAIIGTEEARKAFVALAEPKPDAAKHNPPSETGDSEAG